MNLIGGKEECISLFGESKGKMEMVQLYYNLKELKSKGEWSAHQKLHHQTNCLSFSQQPFTEYKSSEKGNALWVSSLFLVGWW